MTPFWWHSQVGTKVKRGRKEEGRTVGKETKEKRRGGEEKSWRWERRGEW